MKLGDRKFMILKAVIDDYITTAVPVGSRTISRKAGVGYSPATIRNEMSDLEELGYLAQPHTSAGRIPSPKAYRWYVDQILSGSELSDQEAQEIHEYMEERTGQVEEVIRTTAQALSDLTRYTSLVVAPKSKTLTINRVQLVPITETAALMIVVTSGGIVKDSVIRVPEGMNTDHLYSISKMLTEQLHGKSPSEVRMQLSEILANLQTHKQMLASVIDVLENQLEDDADADLFVGGSTNLLSYPEYSDIEKARSFLTMLESKEALYTLLRQSGSVEFSVRIGPENELPELKDCSIITATYKVGNQSSGTLGIIGPTRMRYERVISVLDFMGKAMSDILSGKFPK